MPGANEATGSWWIVSDRAIGERATTGTQRRGTGWPHLAGFAETAAAPDRRRARRPSSPLLAACHETRGAERQARSRSVI